MRRALFVFLAGLPLLAASTTATAAPTHVQVHDHMVQEKVPSPTQVEFVPFTITVPKHWSFQARVVPKPVGDDQMTIDFITSPGNLKTAKVYVGIRERASKRSMQQIRKHLASKKGHRSRTVSWNGQNWILDKFQGPHPHTTVWTAYLVRSGKEYLMVAESPNKRRPRLEPVIISVMKSVKFSSASAPTQ